MTTITMINGEYYHTEEKIEKIVDRLNMSQNQALSIKTTAGEYVYLFPKHIILVK